MARSHQLFKRGLVSIISLSGPHGVGKSTLVGDLKEALKKIVEGGEEILPALNPISLTVFLVPSCSTAWFNNAKKERAEQGLPVPVTYDDINAMGLRERMQRELPGILARMLLDQVSLAIKNGGGVILVDRWFGDIAAYSALELSAECLATLKDEMEEEYNMLLGQLVGIALDSPLDISLSHLYVPVSACAHAMPLGKTADKAHRGVTPQDVWEKAYAAVNCYTDHARTIVITASDRLQRVGEVFAECLD